MTWRWRLIRKPSRTSTGSSVMETPCWLSKYKKYIKAPPSGGVFYYIEAHMKKLLFLLISTHAILMLQAQQEIPLYTAAIPNAKPVQDREKKEYYKGERPGYTLS